MSASPSSSSCSPRFCACFLFAGLSVTAGAGTLTLNSAAANAWDDYVRAENTTMTQRLGSDKPYLWVDESPELVKKLQAGEVVVAPFGHDGLKKVPSGLIHHWIGAIFIPDTRIEDVLRVVRDYPHYKDLYQPGVVESRLISKVDSKDRFSTVLVNRAFLLKSAFQNEFESCYVRIDDHRTYSFTKSMRIQEIEDYGSSGQRALPEDVGSGIMWRLFSVTRYQERDGGVYVEVEAMGLTRDIPAALHWFVDPIVRRVSKSALTVSLRQTEKASRLLAEVSKREREEKRLRALSVRSGASAGSRR